VRLFLCIVGEFTNIQVHSDPNRQFVDNTKSCFVRESNPLHVARSSHCRTEAFLLSFHFSLCKVFLWPILVIDVEFLPPSPFGPAVTSVSTMIIPMQGNVLILLKHPANQKLSMPCLVRNNENKNRIPIFDDTISKRFAIHKL
ncbi:hypothetical protein SFRURICE_001591, partial [Spodoptera frugiperda]